MSSAGTMLCAKCTDQLTLRPNPRWTGPGTCTLRKGNFVRANKTGPSHYLVPQDRKQPGKQSSRTSEKWPKVHVLPRTWRKFRKNFIYDFGLDSTGAGLDTSPDTRKTPRIDQPRWPGKYHMIIHVHEVLVFFGGLCFLFDCLDRGVFVCCFVWLFRSGCFVWGVVCCCWGGHAKTFLFEKLHAQFAVLQIARTRA